jgi:predicted site-specific integrase-resolvase
LVRDTHDEDGIVAIYARVSSSDQKGDLDRQIARLLEYANPKAGQ